MADEIDFNDALDNIFLSENTKCQESYNDGYRTGYEAGNPEGYHLGYHRGAELGRELGYYYGIVTYHIENKASSNIHTDKILKQLQKVQDLIKTFPLTNSEDHNILDLAENIRAQYKKVCALLKLPSGNPYAKNRMQSTIIKLKKDLASTTAFLTPYLPLANCHMVEFFTDNHWETLVPEKLRCYLDDCDLSEAVEMFFQSEDGNCEDNNELNMWMKQTRKYYTSLNSYCISTVQLQEHIKSWGGEVKSEVKITEFMSSKKSYEVQTMSHLIAALYTACKATHCVEAGGGRGNLPVALSLAYHLPSLTVDCDTQTLGNGEKRIKIIQKQWHAIAKKINSGTKQSVSDSIESNLHRFASSYITKNSDLADLVREKFPEYSSDVKLLLTGLHTCGNLGPDSLALFTTRPTISALFNVPCCYHLLSEDVDVELFDVFQKYGEGSAGGAGFPISEGLRGYNLGRNARMLAAQSIHRVVSHRQLPDTSLLYRALIQVIIKKHLPNLPLSEGKLKGISSKCQNFKEYFKMADSILKIGLYEKLSDSYFKDIEKNKDGYNLGRNARMLAAQSIHRVVSHRQLPDTSLLYRALIQVIIKKHLPNLPLSEGKLKGISSKCQNFKEYFKMADSILKIGLYEKLSDSYFKDIEKNKDGQWKKIVLFYLIRLCLAQVVENIILLDRLLFLFENGYEKSFLVKLFDPVLSPRCHGIVAVR